MPEPLPSSGPISIFQITEYYAGEAGANDSLQYLSRFLEPEPEANIAMSLFYSSSCTSFAWSGEGAEEPEEACEYSAGETAYHNGSGTYPVAGDTVYTNSSCTTTAEPAAYKMGSGNVVIVGEGGVVSSIFNECE
tara:strand:- start:1062 stop:1466 length:405 start_codon:yes stop_codon:yes gene_type:complete